MWSAVSLPVFFFGLGSGPRDASFWCLCCLHCLFLYGEKAAACGGGGTAQLSSGLIWDLYLTLLRG